MLKKPLEEERFPHSVAKAIVRQAKEVADISLLSENLDGLLTLRHMSQRLIGRIQGNYRRIIGFNTALLVLGAAGIIRPSTSAVLHNASTMLLCGHSMRLDAKR